MLLEQTEGRQRRHTANSALLLGRVTGKEASPNPTAAATVPPSGPRVFNPSLEGSLLAQIGPPNHENSLMKWEIVTVYAGCF